MHVGTIGETASTDGMRSGACIRTLATEWAYATVYDSERAREATYPDWVHHYNHHRPHTGIGGQVPSARVHNRTGKYT